MMISYIVVMTFVILTMFLKIIDVSYSAVMDRIAGDDDDNFTRDLRDALARIAYDLYWSVMIRLTLLRARYALLFHRPDGDRPALVVDDGSQAGFAAPGKRSLAEKLAARDSARTLAALPEPDDDGDAPPPVDDRTELQRALDKRERHVENRAAKESKIPNFKGSYLGRFPLVSANSWTSDQLSERPRSVDAFYGTRARGTLTLKRR